jgi:C-terminal processing protease CtpA/Prc
MRVILQPILLVVAIYSANGQEFATAKLTGRVTDSSDAPIVGADVTWNMISGARIDRARPIKTTTDKDGRYELTLGFEADKTITVKEVFANAGGFIRASSPVATPLKGDESATLDFVLEKGEVLAGTMRLPLAYHERTMPKSAQEAVSKRLFWVKGPKLKEPTNNANLYQTDSSGRFRIYLPPGEYTLEAVGYGGDGKEPVLWKGIKTGQENVLLEVPPFEWSEKEVGQVFDEFWAAMDAQYSYFFLKTDVDWSAAKEKYRSKAAQAKTAAELAEVLREMLAPLRDGHVWIDTPAGQIATFSRSYNYNGNRQVTLAQLEDRVECGRFAVVGKTRGDGFGYFLMLRQSEATSELVRQAAAAIGRLHDAPGFIVDLRQANGGNELLAAEIARLFCDRETVYAKSKFRSGPGHADFTQEHERKLPASDRPFTKPVVCLIGPGAVSSGEGFVKMMKCLPNVTTVGQATGGSSGNPQPWPLGRTDVAVWFSRWVDLMPDGKTFEGQGIPPAVEVNEPPAAYAMNDPTVQKGLAILRERIGHRR